MNQLYARPPPAWTIALAKSTSTVARQAASGSLRPLVWLPRAHAAQAAQAQLGVLTRSVPMKSRLPTGAPFQRRMSYVVAA